MKKKKRKPLKNISNKKSLICSDCRKSGHSRNDCKIKKKINELNISEDEKQKLLCLLSETDYSGQKKLIGIHMVVIIMIIIQIYFRSNWTKH